MLCLFTLVKGISRGSKDNANAERTYEQQFYAKLLRHFVIKPRFPPKLMLVTALSALAGKRPRAENLLIIFQHTAIRKHLASFTINAGKYEYMVNYIT